MQKTQSITQGEFEVTVVNKDTGETITLTGEGEVTETVTKVGPDKFDLYDTTKTLQLTIQQTEEDGR